jgi:hypothetical protein
MLSAKSITRVRPSVANKLPREKGSLLNETESKAMARVEVVSDMRTGGFEDCALAIVAKTVIRDVSNNQRRQSNAHGRVCFMYGLTIW